MNEQEITSAVQAVLDQMKEAAPQHAGLLQTVSERRVSR